MPEIGQDVIRGFKWLAAGRFAGQMVTWVITIYVIRLLTPEDYGLLAMATLVISFLTLFDELGMGAALIQKETLEENEVRQVFGLVLLINTAAFVLLVLLSGVIADFFGEPRLVDITIVLSVQFPLLALQIIPDAMIRRRMRFRGKSIALFIAMITGSFTTLGLAILGYGVWSLVLGSLCTVLIRTIGFNIVARYYCWPLFSFSGMRKIVTFGGQVTVERLLWFTYSQADIFIIGRILGKELLGYYSVAMHLASLPMQKLGSMLNEVSFSGFSRIQTDTSQISRQVLKATSLMSFFSFPVFFGISSVAPEVVINILGEKWLLATAPLQILSLSIPLRMLDLVIPTALMGIGRADTSVGNAAIAAVVLPICFWVGLDWGLEGVCWGWLIGFSLYYVASLYRSLPKLGVKLPEYLRAMYGPALSAVTMMACVYLCRSILPDSWQNSVLSMLLLIAVGGVSYTLMAFLFHRERLVMSVGLIKG